MISNWTRQLLKTSLTRYTMNCDFNGAVRALYKQAKDICTNNLSENVVFIKRYSFLKRKVYTPEQIMEDIRQYETNGLYIKWLDLSLYYSTAEETFIVVTLYASKTPVETEYHLSAVCASLDQGESGPYDVNDYVDNMLTQKD